MGKPWHIMVNFILSLVYEDYVFWDTARTTSFEELKNHVWGRKRTFYNVPHNRKAARLLSKTKNALSLRRKTGHEFTLAERSENG
jgi:hypothetical protein